MPPIPIDELRALVAYANLKREMEIYEWLWEEIGEAAKCGDNYVTLSIERREWSYCADALARIRKNDLHIGCKIRSPFLFRSWYKVTLSWS